MINQTQLTHPLTHKTTTKSYTLNLHLQLTPSLHTLKIDLKIFHPHFRHFTKIYTSQNYERELKYLSMDLRELFEYLREGHFVDLGTGELTVFEVLGWRGREIGVKRVLGLGELEVEKGQVITAMVEEVNKNIEEFNNEEPVGEVSSFNLQQFKSSMIDSKNTSQLNNHISDLTTYIEHLADKCRELEKNRHNLIFEVNQILRKGLEDMKEIRDNLMEFRKQQDGKEGKAKTRRIRKKKGTKFTISRVRKPGGRGKERGERGGGRGRGGRGRRGRGGLAARLPIRRPNRNKVDNYQGKFLRNPDKFSIVKNSSVKLFQIDRHLITYRGEDKQESGYLVVNFNIRFNVKENRFRIRVVKSKKGFLRIGVVDRPSRLSPNIPRSTTYNGLTTEVRYGTQVERKGSGFKQGDVVQVRILNGEVQWHVNDKLQAQYESSNFGREFMYYMPYIELFMSGDTVQWLPI